MKARVDTSACFAPGLSAICVKEGARFSYGFHQQAPKMINLPGSGQAAQVSGVSFNFLTILLQLYAIYQTHTIVANPSSIIILHKELMAAKSFLVSARVSRYTRKPTGS